MAKAKLGHKRIRILYLCRRCTHRTHRVFLDIASKYGWRIDVVKSVYARDLALDYHSYDAVITQMKTSDTSRIAKSIDTKTLHITLHAEAARDLDLPSVVMDHTAAGALIAQHFIALNFHHFVAVGGKDTIFSLRLSGFRTELQKVGLPPPHILELDRKALDDYSTCIPLMGEALQSVPMPTAIMAHNDEYAIRIMTVCSQHGFSVPSQVALCGFDNDPIACDLAPIPLSSVDTDPELQVTEVMELLKHTLAGKPLNNRHLLIPPKKLVIRRSSGVMASNNPILAKALAYIHQHTWASDLSMPEIATEIGIAETTLYATFRHEMSQTPLAYITKLRIDKARKLLQQTNQKICDIRPQCGFASDYQMYKAFKRETGKPPGAFRC